jgi:hypothetical protein
VPPPGVPAGNSTEHGPHTTFRDAMLRDAEFAAAVQDALDDALGSLKAEAMRRAVEGYQRPVYQKGELVGHETVYSDNMLLTLLRARAPETFSERRDVHVSGAVSHLHGAVAIAASDLLLLDDHDRNTLLEVFSRLAVAKGEATTAPLLTDARHVDYPPHEKAADAINRIDRDAPPQGTAQDDYAAPHRSA